MDYKTLLVEKSGYTAVVSLNRPEKLNAINVQMMMELKALNEVLRGDQKCRFVIFTGKGQAFSCGVEFSREEMTSRYKKSGLANERLWQLFGHDFMHTMENLEQVTIAAINGPAMGAGLCLAMNCDFRIASKKAILGIPEANLGIFFSWGATPRLTALIGPAKTKEMIMTCGPVDASEAFSIGLVNRVVPAEKLMNHCEELVNKIAGKGPLAIRMCKKIVNAASLSKMADLYPCEPELVERLMLSEDVKEGIQAFLDKRPPRFSED